MSAVTLPAPGETFVSAKGYRFEVLTPIPDWPMFRARCLDVPGALAFELTPKGAAAYFEADAWRRS